MLTEEKREQLLKLSTPLAVDAMDRLGLGESAGSCQWTSGAFHLHGGGRRRSAEIPTRSVFRSSPLVA